MADTVRARYYLAECARQRAEGHAHRARGRLTLAEASFTLAKRDAERAVFWLSDAAPVVPAPAFMLAA